MVAGGKGSATSGKPRLLRSLWDVIRKSELKEESKNGYLGVEVLPQADRNEDQALDLDELARYLARERS